jgi:sulfur carrier protein
MIRVNDKWDMPWQAGMTVDSVLLACGFTYRPIVVSINGILVPPEDYTTHQVADGDEIQAIHVIAGG